MSVNKIIFLIKQRINVNNAILRAHNALEIPYKNAHNVIQIIIYLLLNVLTKLLDVHIEQASK